MFAVQWVNANHKAITRAGQDPPCPRRTRCGGFSATAGRRRPRTRHHGGLPSSSFRAPAVGIGDDAAGDVNAALRQFCGDCGIDGVAGADGYGALVDDDLVVGHHRAHAACGGEDVLQAGGAVFVRRRADGDEQDRAVLYRALDVGREMQPPGGDASPDHVLRAGFVDRDAIRFEDAVRSAAGCRVGLSGIEVLLAG